jgi:hypothetical protein
MAIPQSGLNYHKLLEQVRESFARHEREVLFPSMIRMIGMDPAMARGDSSTVFMFPRHMGKTYMMNQHLMDEHVRYTISNKSVIQQELLDLMKKKPSKVKPTPMVAVLKTRVESLEGQLNDVTKSRSLLREELDDTKGALTRSCKMVESLQKDLESARYETANLRQDMQRALGYIDRVNECEPPIPPVAMPQTYSMPMRGPRLNGVSLHSSGCEQSNFGLNDIRGRSRY